VDFANSEVNGWQAEDVRTFRESLGGFFGVVRPSADLPRALPTPPDAWEVSLEDIKRLHLSADAMLGGAAKGRLLTIFDPAAATDHAVVRLRRRGKTTEIEGVSGPITFVFAMLVQLLLASAAGTSVRRCPDPGCRRLFLKVRRQRYCSIKCGRRLLMRKYRAVDRAPGKRGRT
jgi:predicted RNA-binding Zn ribbon-like protein